MAITQFPLHAVIRRPPTIPVSSAVFDDPTPKKDRHAADPLKNRVDIIRISQYLVREKRFRDNLLFIMGINFGFRCSDLVKIKIGHVLNFDGYDTDGSPLLSYKASITLQEQKTKKLRTVYLNKAIYRALDLYFDNVSTPVDFDWYFFRSESNRCTSNKPLEVKSVERILKEVINEKMGIDVHASTHLLRKTFGYQVVMSAPDRSRAIEFLQTVFNHKSPVITMAYIGITSEEIMSVYQNLNLGDEDDLDFFECSGLSRAS